MGTGRVAQIQERMLWMLRPGGEVHHRVGAPADRPDELLDLLGRGETTAELPMLALILTRKLRPMAIGSHRGG
jgi:hypothetical protein